MDRINTMIFNRTLEIETYTPRTICRARLVIYNFPLEVNGQLVFAHGSIFHIYPIHNITHTVFYLSKGSITNIYSQHIELITVSKVLNFKVDSLDEIILVVFSQEIQNTKANWLHINIKAKMLHYGMLLNADINRITIMSKDQFIQHTGLQLIKYEIIKNRCLTSITSQKGPYVRELICLMDESCIMTKHYKGTWSSQKLYNNGTTKSTKLAYGSYYKLMRDMYNDQKVNIIGIAETGNYFTLTHDSFGKEKTLQIIHELGVHWKGIINYDSISHTVHMSEFRADLGRITIFSSLGAIISHVIIQHKTGRNRTSLILPQTHNASSYELYIRKDSSGSLLHQYKGDINDIAEISKILRHVIASRLAHQFSPDHFPAMSFTSFQSNTVGYTYQSPYDSAQPVNCSFHDHAILYAFSAVIGMKIDPDNIVCYEQSTGNSRLFFTDFSKAGLYKWNGVTSHAITPDMVTDEDRGLIIPYPHLGCDVLLPCNNIELASIYRSIHEKLYESYEYIVEAVACDRFYPTNYQQYFTNKWTTELIVEEIAREFRDIIGTNLHRLPIDGDM